MLSDQTAMLTRWSDVERTRSERGGGVSERWSLPLAQDPVFTLEASGEVSEGRFAIEQMLSSVDGSHTVAARIYLPMDRIKSTLS
ncbi:MAG: hypothetical protein ACR2N9_08405 [Acidimicrobiia bacterium]